MVPGGQATLQLPIVASPIEWGITTEKRKLNSIPRLPAPAALSLQQPHLLNPHTESVSGA